MKIKKFISLLASLAMMVTAVTGAMTVSVVSAADNFPTSGKCGESATWLINSDGVLVISGTGEIDTNVFGQGWYKLNYAINEVVVEEGITVASSAVVSTFDRIPNISKIIFPSSLTKLNGCIYKQPNGYTGLKDIFIYSKNVTDASTIYDTSEPEGNTWHGHGTIWHVYKGSGTEKSLREDLKLTDEDIEYISANEQMPTVTNKTPAVLEPVGETSGPAGFSTKYEWDETKKTLTFSGKGLITIADYYKQYAEETEHIVIENGITIIDADTGISADAIGGMYSSSSFTGFTALKDVQLPDGIASISVTAFKNDANLEEINFPNTLNEIGECAFSFCTKLKSIKLHEGMTIGGGAFGFCESLKEVTIPKNVRLKNTTINGAGMQRPACTFESCTGLEKVVIEDGSLLTDAFGHEFTPNGIPENFCRHSKSLKTVIIKGNVEYIASCAFGGNGGTSANIGCPSLTDIYLYNTGLTTITAKNTLIGSDNYADSFDTTNNPTFHVIKGSTTEQTLIDAGYLNDENTVYLPDTTALETAISEAEAIETDKYTEESVSAFTKAIENARALLDNMDATQDEVDNAVKAIEDAKNALAEKPDEPSTDNSSDPSNSSGNNNQSQSPNTPATPSTSAPTTATPKPTTPPTVTTTVAKPAKVKNVKVTAKKKKLNVSWKKVSGATGYEVMSATNNKFTKGKKTVTVKKNKVTLKKLKPKKKYFVKVRAYKLASGRKYFGKWSKVVKKKTK